MIISKITIVSFFINLLIYIVINFLIKNKVKIPIGSIFFLTTIFFLFLFDKFIVNDFPSLLIIILIWLLGFIDDVFNLNVKLRFLISTSLLFIFSLINYQLIIFDIFHLDFFNFLFYLFLTLGFMHMMNMIDGIDGYYIFYFILTFIFFNFIELNNFNISMLISSIFFLVLNLQKKVIIGNSGNYLLSFLLAFCLSINNFQEVKYIDLKFDSNLVLIIYAFPLIDGLRVTMQRLKNRRSPFLKDNNHIHLINNSQLFSLSILSLFCISGLILYLILNNFILSFCLIILLYFFSYNILNK